MKETAVAPSNVAFIKYWGRKNEELRLPANGSISMNLSGLTTTTTVEFHPSFQDDEIVINSEKEGGKGREKIIAHLDRIRSRAGINERAKVVSENSFPRGTGLSSSASGFAALTVAASKALGLNLSEKDLSILARQGSGSACRSVPDGFVEWLDGDSSETSYAHTIFPSDYWDITDLVCILTTDVKDVPTSEGQKSAQTSPFFLVRQAGMNEKIRKVKEEIQEKNFKEFGEIIESEALEMHAIMITSQPSLIYWNPATITLMKSVQRWRQEEEIPVYFTINTGQNMHLICESEHAESILKRLKKISDVQKVIASRPTHGARIVEDHLF